MAMGFEDFVDTRPMVDECDVLMSKRKAAKKVMDVELLAYDDDLRRMVMVFLLKVAKQMKDYFVHPTLSKFISSEIFHFSHVHE
jgi:hypothetical protein